LRIIFQVSGGVAYFPKLASPRTVDVEKLDAESRHDLERLIQDAAFFDLPAILPAPRGAADCQTYRITIEDAGRHHTVAVTEPISRVALQALVERLRRLAVP
jgi:hypothetical protein